MPMPLTAATYIWTWNKKSPLFGAGESTKGEYAATGRMRTMPRLTAGEYADLVDEQISKRLEQEHGKLASGAYRIGTKAFDSVASYGVLGPELDLFKSAGESSADALVKAKKEPCYGRAGGKLCVLERCGRGCCGFGNKWNI